MENKLFTKVLSREMPLIAVESLDVGFTKRNSDFFGISFPESVFIYRNKLFECFRDKEKFNNVPKELSKITDFSIFDNAILKIKESIVSLSICLEEIESISSEDDIKSILDKIADTYSAGFCGLIVTDRIPQWSEQQLGNFDISIIEHAKVARHETQGFFELGVRAFDKVLEKISLMRNVEISVLNLMTTVEIHSLLDEGVAVLEGVKERIGGQIIFYNGSVYKDKSELPKVIQIVEDTISGQVVTISGRPAYPGIVKGKVRKVFSQEDLSTVQDGEVLVTPMTTPSFVPILSKVIGIITDEGGVTCHAAIVAREMKKPCIVGTKNATQVLQTGDVVELNAERGTVSILK